MNRKVRFPSCFILLSCRKLFCLSNLRLSCVHLRTLISSAHVEDSHLPHSPLTFPSLRIISGINSGGAAMFRAVSRSLPRFSRLTISADGEICAEGRPQARPRRRCFPAHEGRVLLLYGWLPLRPSGSTSKSPTSRSTFSRSKDNRHAIVTTNGFNQHNVSLVDLQEGENRHLGVGARQSWFGFTALSKGRKQGSGGRAAATATSTPSTSRTPSCPHEQEGESTRRN